MDNKEKKEINKLSLLIVIVVVLVLVVAGGGYYIYHQNEQMEGLVQSFDLEKEEMEDELNELSFQYEGYKFSVGSDSLAALLSTEQAKVQRLLEELRTVKATDAREISRLKKEISTLRKIMRNYVVQIDSLNTENERLKDENKQVVKRYQQANSQAVALKKEKEKLTEQVTLASKLDATNIEVTPLTSRSKPAKRIKKMQQFRITFQIAKNVTAEVGEKTIYVRIMKPDDDVQLALAEKVHDELAAKGVEVMLDDRDERPGVKFKDADLLGIPVRITVGRMAPEGKVEYKLRRDAEKVEMTAEEAVKAAVALVEAER